MTLKRPPPRPALKLRPRHRIIKSGGGEPPRDPTLQQSRYISEHPQRPVIVDAMREGVPVSEISRMLVREGLIELTETTCYQYLLSFRKHNQGLFAPDPNSSFEGLIAGRRTKLDPLDEATKLWRLQKSRLAIGHRTEVSMGLIVAGMQKEVEAGTKLLELMGKLSGSIGASNGANDDINMGPDARDELRRIEKEEAGQAKMQNLVGSLARSIRETITS